MNLIIVVFFNFWPDTQRFVRTFKHDPQERKRPRKLLPTRPLRNTQRPVETFNTLSQRRMRFSNTQTHSSTFYKYYHTHTHHMLTQ